MYGLVTIADPSVAQQQVDVATFVFIAVVCVLYVLISLRYHGGLERRTLLKAGGVLMFAGVLLFGTVIPSDALGSGATFAVMIAMVLVGVYLLHKAAR